MRIPSSRESVSLPLLCWGSTTPAFRAAVRGRFGDRVGRDAQGVSRSRLPAAISLSRHIPVPQCADGAGEKATPVAIHAVGSLSLIVQWMAALGPGSTKAQHDPLIVPGERQA